jgi:hygromycin-B 4-O-kinase
MKTTHSIEQVRSFLDKVEGANPATLTALTEGHISQAFSFEDKQGARWVLRIGPDANDFYHDQYAYEHFGDILPVPYVREVGQFDESSYFCISQYVDGVTSNTLEQITVDAMQAKILDTYATLFNIDTSATKGYGRLDVRTGNGTFASWRERLLDSLEDLHPDSFRKSAQNINLDVVIVDKLLAQAETHLPFAPESRNLLHGDLGFDNMIIKDGKVASLIDWADVGYGDWLYDYSKFEFWWPGRHIPARDFAARYGFEVSGIREREILYRAVTALGTIKFADEAANAHITGWLRDHLPRVLENGN